MSSSVTESRVDGQSVDMANRAQTRRQFRLDVELEQASHLPVAVLLHHIHALVPLNEVVNLARKRIRQHTKIVRFQFVLFGQLIARLDDRPVRRAISNNADLRLAAARHFRSRYEQPRGLELLVDPFHVAFEIVRTLAVLSPFHCGRCRAQNMPLRDDPCPAACDSRRHRHPHPCSGQNYQPSQDPPYSALFRDQSACRDKETDPTSSYSSPGRGPT